MSGAHPAAAAAPPFTAPLAAAAPPRHLPAVSPVNPRHPPRRQPRNRHMCFVQMPDGLVINFDHVLKLRKIDYVLEDGHASPLIWLKFATGEEERISFANREARDTCYRELKQLLGLRAL